MRSRISGTTLLPAVLAAATITAVAVPVAAHEAPPPAPETYTEPAADGAAEADGASEKDDCALALKVLSHYKLLPNQPEVGRALCSRNQAEQQEEESQPGEGGPAEGRPAQRTTSSGRTVEENRVLGTPVEWPKNLTVHLPTVNDHWYTYTSKKPG
ncbi:hypothetical protein ACH35V_42135 [Actinomadura sp. 1N219]|uniref:hypothetical protein n=1 Tax=Actinomadura sp. 1N219 TaxID=3375152 RepID=UPI0037B83802